jgi:D-alanyl-lipoteichoic acid acyltransferase DltB (MBOAT superfamily)
VIFNSVTYCVFLVAVVGLYWVLPRTPRLWLLMLASLTFYGFWRVEFLPVMLASAVTDYFAARGIHRSEKPLTRKLLVLLSLCVNLGLLGYFKYLLFFADNVSGLMRLVGVDWQPPALNIILPLGISFYTFQTISYTIDVYRGFITPERNFVLYCCYVTFFPQLVAGPILRAREVVHQLDRRPCFCSEDVALGLRRALYGLFLKVVLADNIGPVVDQGFAQDVSALSALDVWTLAFLFGFQIYFDFSAYSHIALGSARLMGIKFPENFNFPYMASSPRDFWRRWHISLSSWIRDYLYLPLAGAKVHDRSTGGLGQAPESKGAQTISAATMTRALFLTWAIMGLWHGAAWTFVFWGLYHASFVYLYRLSLPALRGLPPVVARAGGWVVTLPFAMLSWIAFRAVDLDQMFSMYGRVLTPSAYTWLGLRENSYLLAALMLLAMVATYYTTHWLAPRLRSRPLVFTFAETASLAVIISLVFVFLRPISQFIYFQF